jgi:CheY-like chemotaxis protein
LFESHSLKRRAKREEKLKKSISETTVLVVDDDLSLRELLESEFSERGFRVFGAENGEEAFKVIEKHPIDVVLSDIRMPKVDGRELLNKVKSAFPKRPAVLLLSGFSLLPLEDAMNEGAEGIFGKPFELDEICEAVVQMMTLKEERWAKERTDTKSLPSLHVKLPSFKDAIAAKRFNLGNGGMFIGLEKDLPNPDTDLNFKIEFDEPNTPSIEGTGRVRWVRKQNTGGQRAGCGIEFTYLKDNCRTKVVHLIQNLPGVSFIPRT